MIAITGANGYVGTCLAAALPPAELLRLVRAPVQAGQLAWSFGSGPRAVANMLREHNVKQIVHTAWDMKASRLSDLQETCVAGSHNLLAAARAAGVKKFVFISTISAFAGARSAYGRAKLMVETDVLAAGGTVIRPGLIYGDGEGGMFGSLRRAVAARFVPVIGDGSAPQYLLHERDLQAGVLAALRGGFDDARQAVTLAATQAVPFRDLVREIARREGRRITLVPMPWRVLYGALRAAELTGLRPDPRSDSVLSFVFQNPVPDFSVMQRHGIAPAPFILSGAA